MMKEEQSPTLNQTPMGERYHIGIFGKRNAGKSTIMNGLTHQTISVVSEVAGTTTDPVYKAMELLPIGPVLLIDTAGFDDIGELGELRVKKTLEVLRKIDFAILLISSQSNEITEELEFLRRLSEAKIPFIIGFTKEDLSEVPEKQLMQCRREEYPYIIGNGTDAIFIEELKKQIIRLAGKEEKENSLVNDLVKPGEVAILVVPIDSAAPKGRLILPQQQTIRDLLEEGAMALVTRESELKQTLESLKQPPAIVITDSQAFELVSKIIPEDVKLTSFSILFARKKGELNSMTYGAKQIAKLCPGDSVLIVEGCTHHRQKDDIGTVKLPRWLNQRVGGELNYSYVSGGQFPEDVSKYQLIIHCGGCMLPRREIQYRLQQAKKQGVPITNYGTAIAFLKGILQRAIQPIKEVE